MTTTARSARSTRIVLIADEGGGLTLQVRGRRRYAHHYDRPAQLATDLRELLANGNTTPEWSGNDLAAIGWQETQHAGEVQYSGTVADVIAALRQQVESERAGAAEIELVAALDA